jgi:hypothetical protein
LCGDVGVAAESTDLSAILVYAEFVFAKWRARGKFRELKNHHGNIKNDLRIMIYDLRIHNS